MRKLDGRTLATYTVITVVGLALLSLVLPSIVSGPIPLILLGSLFLIIPLTVIAAVLFYQFGSSKSATKTLRRCASVLLANVAAASTLLSVVCTMISTGYTISRTKFVYENIGVALLFIALVCVLVLINRQKFVYWPFWNMKDRRNSDERQKAVRNRVYEKSYRALIVLLIVAVWIGGTHSQRLHDELFQAMALCIFGVPAIIAAWQKDS